MAEASKKLKKMLRQHADRAWEAETTAALQALSLKFDEWKDGRMSSSDLHDAIHQYHDGVGREIWNRFATNKAELPLAHAVAEGFIPKESLPPEVLAHIGPLVEFFQNQTQDK